MHVRVSLLTENLLLLTRTCWLVWCVLLFTSIYCARVRTFGSILLGISRISVSSLSSTYMIKPRMSRLTFLSPTARLYRLRTMPASPSRTTALTGLCTLMGCPRTTECEVDDVDERDPCPYMGVGRALAERWTSDDDEPWWPTSNC